MTINNKTYKFPELTFDEMCKLEDMGVSLTDLEQKPMTMIRGFLALAIGDMGSVGKELEEHIAGGGDFEEILDEITKAVSDSGFFRALTPSQETGTSTSKKSTKKTK